MKLYTEKQVSIAINAAKANPKQAYLILAMLRPIELPSDEDIRKESHDYFIRGQLGFEAAADTERAFLRGVLWMRDKILNK